MGTNVTSKTGTVCPSIVRVEAREAPMPAGQLRSLHDFLGEMDDFRKRRGQRYALGCYLTIMIAARLAGYRGVSAFGEFAARCAQPQARRRAARLRPGTSTPAPKGDRA